MKNANRARFAMAACAALALSGMSSSASAQPGDPQYCEELAWATCNPNQDPWMPWMYYCWHETYDICMAGQLASIGREADVADRRSEPAAVRL